jgi:hypothetical protein
MEAVTQTKATKSFLFWVASFGVPIWAGVSLVQIWRRLAPGPDARAVIIIFGAAAVVFVTVILSYFLFPHRRGSYAKHLVAAAFGGLTAISLTEPVFAPLIRFQMGLMARIMPAADLGLISDWYGLMNPYGACIEVVLIGMAGGWLFVAIQSRWTGIKGLNRSKQG